MRLGCLETFESMAAGDESGRLQRYYYICAVLLKQQYVGFQGNPVSPSASPFSSPFSSPFRVLVMSHLKVAMDL